MQHHLSSGFLNWSLFERKQFDVNSNFFVFCCYSCLSLIGLHQLLILPITGGLENKRRAYYQRTWWSHADIYHFLDMNKTEIYIFVNRNQIHCCFWAPSRIKYMEVSKLTENLTERVKMRGNLTPEKLWRVILPTAPPFCWEANPILTTRSLEAPPGPDF